MTTAVPALAGAVLVRGDVVTPSAVARDAVVAVRAGTIVWVGPSGEVAEDLLPAPAPGLVVLPGLVDLHCHGGGGAGFPDATGLEDVRHAADEHLRHGTTTLVASLVTAPRDDLLTRTALLADAADAGVVAGVHLEGPFLSVARCGAQHPDHMCVGDAALVRELAAAARGHLLTMTVAPEVPGVADGGDDVLAALVGAGALPSVGHTDATAEVTEAAIARAFDLLATVPQARGARGTATHLFNGMRPLHHRDPGPVAACLAAAARGELVVELVADGTHLAPATVRSVLDLVGPDGVVLVTDAVAAAGAADGDHRLGPHAVRVVDGVARVLEVAPDGTASAGAIAGGTAHLLDVVRGTVAAGVPLVAAVRAASTTPADVLGRRDVGALVPGRRADLLVTTADLRPVRVARGGVWVA
ncbi:N-acetylglucosamine-6-phosphate deacetylase [Cellulomonas flavigena DSM 20109]|uniref:N-acetylglucosamine-6-phosphate deacetylase n=1 Tax=Cellulomonas flavigena (strain ATCC 482 / DSM 20109 / BCRC 11376 / JCM 18109 / NBRC 3775 / NCIMB 8073 / NRS 134) TaxID=446466 RepID=D5ULE5_CELFN|nr:amidohydrolase family protein [Cellulomonas flavigena]ADG73987.1 N-acetylglucosamine-6-phosphate deacetylase [Cellulomonas flavigena DSM 20109]